MEPSGAEDRKCGVVVSGEQVHKRFPETMENVVCPYLIETPFVAVEMAPGQGVRHYVLPACKVGSPQQNVPSSAEVEEIPGATTQA